MHPTPETESAQALAKAGKTGKRPGAGRGTETAVRIKPAAQPDHFLEPVEHVQASIHHLRDNHVKTVRPEIQGRDNS